MPKLRRSRFMRSDSCVAVHWARRDSRGCVDVMGDSPDEDVCDEKREERRVSGRPGAEGAPRSRCRED